MAVEQRRELLDDLHVHVFQGLCLLRDLEEELLECQRRVIDPERLGGLCSCALGGANVGEHRLSSKIRALDLRNVCDGHLEGVRLLDLRCLWQERLEVDRLHATDPIDSAMPVTM